MNRSDDLYTKQKKIIQQVNVYSGSTATVYLHLPMCLDPNEFKAATAIFEKAGYNPDHIIRNSSINEAIGVIPPLSMLVIYSLDCCENLEELIATLFRMEQRHIELRSLKEPWANPILQDLSSCLSKLNGMITPMQTKPLG